MDPAIEAAALRGQVAGLEQELAFTRQEVVALKGVTGIQGAVIKRLQRLLTEATYGAEARKNGPSSARAIDKA
jgi:hypothetical protein